MRREGLFLDTPSDVHWAIEPGEAAVLGRLMEVSLDELGDLPLAGVERNRFLGSLLSYLGYHLDIRSVQSLEVLRELF